MQLKLPSVLSDSLVLQRNKPISIWGWAPAGQTVQAQLAGQSASEVADADGRFRVLLPSLEAGGPFELTVSAGGETITLRDVLIGEVWICSGQSNMEWPVKSAKDASEEIAKADWPHIRMFNLQRNNQNQPQEDAPGRWLHTTAKEVGEFSAVGYFFARKLYQELQIPIGMVHTSWGGTTAEAWTSVEALDQEPSLRYLADAAKLAKPPEELKPHVDLGISDHVKTWPAIDLDDADWIPKPVAATWQATGGPQANGAAWYRLKLNLPAHWVGDDLLVSLGAIDDIDDTFFNGEPIGRTTMATPNFWSHPRQYTLPGKLTRAGENVLAVRVFDQWGAGGLIGPAPLMHVSRVGAATDSIPLLQGWRFKMERELPLRSPGNSVLPTALYNGMVAPLVNLSVRGAIWYQGESNADRAAEYRTLLPVMVRDWRTRFSQGEFPFFIVELANFHAQEPAPSKSTWAELREAQHITAKTVGNSGVACAIDIGDVTDIHPTNKQDVAHRLALLALHDTYGQSMIISRGPTYAGMAIEGDRVRIRFTNCGTGLVSSDRRRGIVGFAIAGKDRVFQWADATVDGTDVIVQSKSIANPAAVRYAWADNPDCTLINSAGLPAYPFRTDQW